MVGSANISGSSAMHMMTGNLSFQIEHHLFPDMPSRRYKEISPRIRDLFERHNLPYVTGSLPKQVTSAWHKVFRLALPNNAFGRFNRAPEWVKEPAAPADVTESDSLAA
jgi:linoleoyl-CoA desaturase